MPLPRVFPSAVPGDWVSSLIAVARSLVPVANCVPFPYVTVALTAGLALLELIQMVGQSSEDLKYLAESVATIMKLLRQEMDAHPMTEDSRFQRLCLEFEIQLTQLTADLRSMSKKWSSSRFKKYLNSHNIREQITRFTREVGELRANATLIAATGTRLELEGVARQVVAVESGIANLRHELTRESRLKPPTAGLEHELARYEQDFHAIKLGDIHLEFATARPATFVEWDVMGNEMRRTAWIDYRATVRASVQTIRVYQGSHPMEAWFGFLSFLAENSPSPYLPQLFGFCSSPRLISLVFHDELCPLDEYAKRLPTMQRIVEWELNLMSDISKLSRGPFHWSFGFALVNPKEHGKMVISHINTPLDSPSFVREHYPPFLEWFVRAGQWLVGRDHPPEITASPNLNNMKDRLQSLVHLRRVSPCDFPSSSAVLTARGCVHHLHGAVIAQLPSRQIQPSQSWSVVYASVFEPPGDTLERPDRSGWPDAFLPTVVDEPTSGFTHFVVPLLTKSRRWLSLHDHRIRSGYFLSADIEFGQSVPDIAESWLLQSSAIRPHSAAFRECDASEFVIPICTKLNLTWEMVLNVGQEEESTCREELPEKIHVFVQLPILEQGKVNEPRIYWSTHPNLMRTELPRAAFTIRMLWSTYISVMRWESHHYAVAREIQEEYAFDAMTSEAAKSLDLPRLEVTADELFVRPGAPLRENDWCRYYERDPHTMEEFIDRSRPYPLFSV